LSNIIPKGWFIPVSPGTKFITVGGAIAADIHGKNHHLEGTLSKHLLWLELLIHDGTIVRCSENENTALFRLTCGGMGLTGIILSASFRLKKIESDKIRYEKITASNLNDVMRLFEDSSAWTYSVAWIDCLAKGRSKGRSILMRGEHATTNEAGKYFRKKMKKQKFSFPFYLPAFALNHFTAKAFNEFYYRVSSIPKQNQISSFDFFFYPLDSILNWNRIYGKRGFTQYQFVLPMKSSYDGLNEILTFISGSGMGSFLAVLKLFGEENKNILSFPMKGYTLALDFPVTKKLFPLLNELDSIVADFGGRIYLAKDMRVRMEMLKRMYPRFEIFSEGIKKYNPDFRFRSLQSDRAGFTK
ncbi:MAG: FAD-binding oxidoreductase, partial [Bacteroidia bacterium]|nr:FAD-binding oxidoreductase [Bacteroidia bacterium]